MWAWQQPGAVLLNGHGDTAPDDTARSGQGGGDYWIAGARVALSRGVRGWLELAQESSASLASEPGQGPGQGHGRTARLWSMLASYASVDLSLARAIEPHLDALAILSQAGETIDPALSWGVYAAEGQGRVLSARESDGEWTVSGEKPWCSLAASLDRAIVTAHREDGERQAFAVDLTHPGVRVLEVGWPSLGLVAIPSGPVAFTDVPARPIGGPGWYLSRPGFAWGGIGVAAVWFGGTVALARSLCAAADAREPDQIAQMHLGAVDESITAAWLALSHAAELIDAGMADDHPAALALRVRGLVVRCAEEVLHRVGHGLGPAPLAFDAEHARRVGDLQVYVRQHHAERDQAALGREVLAMRDSAGTDTRQP